MKDLYKNGLKYYVFDKKNKKNYVLKLDRKNSSNKIKLLTGLFSCDKINKEKRISNKEIKEKILENNSKNFPEELEQTKFSFASKKELFVINFIVNL